MPGKKFTQVLHVFVNLFVYWDRNLGQVNYLSAYWYLRLLAWVEVGAVLDVYTSWLDEEHVPSILVVLLLLRLVLSHQIVCVAFAKIDGALSSQVDELFIFCPVVLGIWVPVHSKFSNGKQGEWPFLLNFVVDVEEGSLEPIVRHTVADRFCHKTKVEGLVTAAHVGILKPDVYIAEVNTQIFPNHLH